MKNQESQIIEKALELGYESCGIIDISEMTGFADVLKKRIEKAPGNEGMYGGFYSFANLQERYHWAKSLVVCVISYGHYSIPEHLDGVIGKHYLVDVRSNEDCSEYITSIKFEEYLRTLGLEVETERRFGITAMRWAADKAGLGIVRRNNFFYTESGSWVHIEAFLTDADMEKKGDYIGKPCPPDCNRCISLCPTKSLSEPNTMSPATCVSPLTVRGDDQMENPIYRKMGRWVYGCDTCQDVCPFNEGKWAGTAKFPGLSELAGEISLESIVTISEERLIELLASKFFYIDRARIVQWKVNALGAMLNDYRTDYAKTINAAKNDPNERVSEMAKWVAGELSL